MSESLPDGSNNSEKLNYYLTENLNLENEQEGKEPAKGLFDDLVADLENLLDNFDSNLGSQAPVENPNSPTNNNGNTDSDMKDRIEDDEIEFEIYEEINFEDFESDTEEFGDYRNVVTSEEISDEKLYVERFDSHSNNFLKKSVKSNEIKKKRESTRNAEDFSLSKKKKKLKSKRNEEKSRSSENDEMKRRKREINSAVSEENLNQESKQRNKKAKYEEREFRKYYAENRENVNNNNSENVNNNLQNSAENENDIEFEIAPVNKGKSTRKIITLPGDIYSFNCFSTNVCIRKELLISMYQQYKEGYFNEYTKGILFVYLFISSFFN